MDTAVDFLIALKKRFEARRNTEYAGKMKSYLRNQFEFIGLNAGTRREIQRELLRDKGFPGKDDLLMIVRELWTLPEREYQHCAAEWMGRYIKKADRDIIRLIEYLISTKSWWDTVDYIAINLAGTVFRKYPDLIIPVTSRWMDSGNIWLQRSCILFQLKYKKDTDLELVYSFIDRLSGSKEFFIKKAIGWFLREYSKLDPMEVKRFVESRKLQPLSVREAMKYV